MENLIDIKLALLSGRPLSMDDAILVSKRLNRLASLEKRIQRYTCDYAISLDDLDRVKMPKYIDYARGEMQNNLLNGIRNEIKIEETDNEYTKNLTGSLYIVRSHEDSKEM